MISHLANQWRVSLNYFQLCSGGNRTNKNQKTTTFQIYLLMNDVVCAWNEPSISRPCCGLSQELDSVKGPTTPAYNTCLTS